MSETGDSPDGPRPPRPGRARPPVTIDLEATHEDGQPGGPDTQPKRGFAARWPFLFPPVIGGVVTAALIAAIVVIVGLSRTPDDNDAAVAALRRDVDQLKSGMSRAEAPDPAIARIEARLADLDQRVAALTSKLSQPAAPDPSTTTALQELGRRVAALEAALRTNPADVAELERRVDALKERVDPPSVAPRVDLPGAIDSLRAAANRGRGFADELALVRSLGGNGAQLDAIAPFAAKGVPGGEQLAEEFPSVADAILRTATPESSDGILGRIGERARSLVTVRPSAPMEGSSTEAIVSRMLARAKEGDLEAALAEWKALPEAGRTASQAWARSVEARLELDQRIAVLASQERAP
jgi:hypothetical protein